MKLLKKCCFFLFLIFLSTFFVNDISAQITSSGIAITTPVNDSQTQDADIICTYDQGNQRCNSDYDPAMFGIISDNPAASIEDKDIENSRLVISSGIATVRVSSVNGDIKVGNFVTSSENPGVAQLAKRNGYVLGMALEDYQNENKEQVGKIQVMVNT